LAANGCNQEPDFQTRAPVIPDAPPEHAASLSDGWHWIHPYPTPYSLRDLQPTSDGAVGIGHMAYQRGRDDQTTMQPVSLEDDYSIPPLPFEPSYDEPDWRANPFGNGLIDLSSTHRGWLALSAVGVFDFDAQGNLESTALPATVDAPTRVSGKSADTFAAFQEGFAGGFVFRDGERSRYTDLRGTMGNPRSLRMWPDGTIWEVFNGDGSPERWMKDAWRGFPALPEDQQTFRHTLGPGPSSTCAGAGIWTTGREGLHRWEPDARQWVLADYDGPRVTSINCDHTGRPLVTDANGGFSRRVDGNWKRTDIDDRALRSAAPAGLDAPRKTYITGDDGMVAEFSGGDVTKITGGFRLPQRLASLSNRRRFYSDFWVSADGSKGVLIHESGFYHGSNGRWTSKPHQFALGLDGEWDEVWGIDDPEFAILKAQLRRWDGSQWVKTELGEFKGAEEGARDLAGTSTDNVWLATNDALFRYDGTSWSNLIEERSLRLTALRMEEDGTLFAAEAGRIYRVAQRDGEWQLTEPVSTPCRNIQSVFRDEEGRFWVAGKPNCIAKQEADGWVNFTFSLVADPREMDNGSKTFVPQPGDRPPLIVTEAGVVAPKGDGTLRTLVTGQFTGGDYLPEAGVGVLLHQHGVLANYYER
jgi:hypothetical protein